MTATTAHTGTEPMATLAAPGGQGTVGDYVVLLKPRVMYLVVFTAVAGLFAAPGEMHPWFGFVTTAGTPPDVVARLNREVNAILATKDFQDRMLQLGQEVKAMTPAQLGALIAEDSARWGQVRFMTCRIYRVVGHRRGRVRWVAPDRVRWRVSRRRRRRGCSRPGAWPRSRR